MIPKRLVVVLDGADGLCHREDVLLVGPAVRLAANVPQGVVAAALDAGRKGRDGVEVGEVETLHAVTVGCQHGSHFATERAFGVEHDVACVHLQQVGLEDVSGLAGSRGADHKCIVVESRLAGVAGKRSILGEDGGRCGLRCGETAGEVRHGRPPWWSRGFRGQSRARRRARPKGRCLLQ